MILFFTIVAAFLLSAFLTYFTASIARKYGFVDDPKVHNHPAVLHKKIIPRAGGLPIFLTFTILSLVILGPSQKLFGIILGGAVLVVVGLIDDKYDLKSHVKLLTQILSAIIVVGSGVGIAFIPNPISAVLGQGYEVIRLDSIRIVFDFLGQHSVLLLADIFAIFWIVWVINMVNFSTGVDGQMPGITLIALLVMFAVSLRFFPTDPSQVIVGKIALIGAGATLGFLLLNFYPAKIFPGDSGSYFLGYLVAVCAILSGAKVGTAILVMAVPLIDGVFTIIRRVAQGKSPFLGDRKHLHHRLIEIGWGQRRIALFYWLLCAILGSAALLLHSVEKLFAGVAVAIIILGGILWLNMNLPQKVQK